MTSYSYSDYSSIPSINVEQLAQVIAERGESIQLIDVREPHEVEMAYVEGFFVLPLSEFVEWSEDLKTHLNPEVETIVMCHHGIRSAQMCQWLFSVGFTDVKNVTGGIDAYSLVVDPTIPRY
jgi:rhodanese-related sulfurtransferase